MECLQGLQDNLDLTSASLLFCTNCLALTAICNRCQHTPPLARRHCSTVARCPGLSGRSPYMPLCCCCSCILSSACSPSVTLSLAALCSASCASSPGGPCLPTSGPAPTAVSPAVSAELLKAVAAVAIAAGSVGGCLGLWPCCDRDPDASSCDPTTHTDTLSQMPTVIAA